MVVEGVKASELVQGGARASLAIRMIYEGDIDVDEAAHYEAVVVAVGFSMRLEGLGGERGGDTALLFAPLFFGRHLITIHKNIYDEGEIEETRQDATCTLGYSPCVPPQTHPKA